MNDVEVAPEAIGAWLSTFADAHGQPTASADAGGWTVRGADGVGAHLDALGAASGRANPEEVTGANLAALVRPVERIGIVLIRRSGYALGLSAGAALPVHVCGSRYVQSRTAAGGTSQHRYARRRGNQADALVGAVATLAADRLAGSQALVLGGDRALVRAVLADPRLDALSTLVRREFYDLPDPNFGRLRHALWRGRAVRVRSDA